jgi:cytochrome c oxidase subunit 1
MRSNTLEWTAPIEHIHGNWPGEIQVHRWPYDYSKPGFEEDFCASKRTNATREEILHH